MELDIGAVLFANVELPETNENAGNCNERRCRAYDRVEEPLGGRIQCERAGS